MGKSKGNSKIPIAKYFERASNLVAGAMAMNAPSKIAQVLKTSRATGPYGYRLPTLNINKTPHKRQRRSVSKAIGMRGRYAGKYKKGKRKAMKRQGMAKYGNGAIRIRETCGKVEDVDCVYLYAHSVVPLDTIKLVADVLVRKICERAFTKTYQNMTDLVLGGLVPVSTGGYTMCLKKLNTVSGVQIDSAFAFNGTKTLSELSDDLYPHLVFYSAGGDEIVENVILPVTLTIYKEWSIPGSSDSLLIAQLNLNDELLEYESQVELKVQNRSVSAGGLSITDVVDVNPVQGYLYEFNSIPKSRDMVKQNTQAGSGIITGGLFSRIRAIDGMNLIRASQLPSGYREPIGAKTFNNSIGVRKIRLEPGNIKSTYKKYYKKINVVRFLELLNYQPETASDKIYLTRTLGGGIMQAFEDVINVNNANTINITYEAEHKMGCRLITRKKRMIIHTYNSDVYENAVA